MKNTVKFFEEFLLDGGVNHPDMYIVNEPEDFSPSGVISAAFINRFAESNRYDFKYDMIA